MSYYWDKNGNVIYDTPEKVPLSFIEKQQRKLQALVDNSSSWLNNSNPDSEAYKQKANIALGLITAPIGGSSALTSNLAKPLTPLLGKKIGQNVAQGIGSGLTGGAVEGFGRGLIENENPLKTMAEDSVTGGTLGGLGGYGLGKIAKNLEKQRILNNAGNSAMLNNWFNDYVDGLSNKTKPLAEYRALKQGINGGNIENLFDINGHLNIDDFDFTYNQLPRSNKHNYHVYTIEENKLPKEIVSRLKRAENKRFKDWAHTYNTKGGEVRSGLYNNQWTKQAVQNAIDKYNTHFNKKSLKEIANTDEVKNFHKQNNLSFNVDPETNIIEELQIYKSPVYNKRQSSAYSLALDNDGNVYYKRKSNHWGNFHTNIYEDDILKQNKPEYEQFLKDNPGSDHLDFLESLGYNTSDPYGRVGRQSHLWDLIGGDTNSHKSQSGYIKIGNINENKLFDKLTNDNNKLKSVNLNDKINYIDLMDEAEKARITSELNTNLSKTEKRRKKIKRSIGNYHYHIKNNGFNNYDFTGRYLIDDLFNR